MVLLLWSGAELCTVQKNCPLDHNPERWLGPQFQSSSTWSAWACFLLSTISFCAHAMSGSHLEIYFLSFLDWRFLNHKNWNIASEVESGPPCLLFIVLTKRLSLCLIPYEPSWSKYNRGVLLEPFPCQETGASMWSKPIMFLKWWLKKTPSGNLSGMH